MRPVYAVTPNPPLPALPADITSRSQNSFLELGTIPHCSLPGSERSPHLEGILDALQVVQSTDE